MEEKKKPFYKEPQNIIGISSIIVTIMLAIFIGQDGENNIKNINSPNSVNTIGNGNIVNVGGIPEPKIEFEQIKSNVQEGEIYISEGILKINSLIPVKELIVTVESKSLDNFDLEFIEQNGFLSTSSTEIVNGKKSILIRNARGKYKLIINTREKENKINIGYDYKPFSDY